MAEKEITLAEEVVEETSCGELRSPNSHNLKGRNK